MGNLIRRFTLASISLVCLACVGCLYVPYCLPEINSVGEVRVPWPSDDVHIFRVDGTEDLHLPHGFVSTPPYLMGSHELARLKPSDRKTLPSQWTVGVEHGWLSIGLVNERVMANKHTLAVRFYRVGYETINVGPGDVSKDLDWKAVYDLSGQEKAVDDLIGANSRYFDKDRRYSVNDNRAPASGRNSAAHREALLFCAAEYDRIAWFVTPKESDADGMRSRLEKKSKRLRALVDGER
jgi:hypothetical protein